MAGVVDSLPSSSSSNENQFGEQPAMDITESSSEINVRKRRLSSGEETPSSSCHKKIILSEDRPEATSEPENKFNLLHFSDEILLEVFIHCNSLTLISLSKTCLRFENLVKDRILWTIFDFSKRMMSAREISKRLKYVSKITEKFSVRGFVSKHPLDKWRNNTITPSVLRQLTEKCPNLKTFAVYDGYINFEKIPIADFPKSLKRLILNGCAIPSRPTKMFNEMDTHLQFLEELSLEKCHWFETHDLILFSKLPQLKKLNLRGCSSLKECVPYGSIATRFGFRKLESLDIRDTPVSDSDIQCFNITATLRELLMECPSHLRERKGADFVKVSLNDDDDSSDDDSSDDDDDDIGAVADMESKNATDVESIRTATEDEDDNASNTDAEEDDKKPVENVQQPDGPAAGSSSQNHFIHVFLRDGNLVNVNNEGGLRNDYQMREINGIRYMVGVLNGGGPEEVLQRQLQERENEQARTVQKPENQAEQINSATGSAAQLSSSESGSRSEANIDSGAGPSNHNVSSASSSSENTVKPLTEENQTNQNGNKSIEPATVPPEIADNEEPQPNPARDAGANQQQLIIIHQRRPEEGDNNSPNFFRNRLISCEIRNRRQVLQSFNPPFNRLFGDVFPTIHNLVSDRGICGFGQARENVQEGVVWIRAEARPVDTLIERLVVRNYRTITDTTLRHLALCAPNLQYLDVTGTSVTSHGIRQFKVVKPNCVVVSHLAKKSI